MRYGLRVHVASEDDAPPRPEPYFPDRVRAIRQHGLEFHIFERRGAHDRRQILREQALLAQHAWDLANFLYEADRPVKVQARQHLCYDLGRSRLNVHRTLPG